MGTLLSEIRPKSLVGFVHGFSPNPLQNVQEVVKPPSTPGFFFYGFLCISEKTPGSGWIFARIFSKNPWKGLRTLRDTPEGTTTKIRWHSPPGIHTILTSFTKFIKGTTPDEKATFKNRYFESYRCPSRGQLQNGISGDKFPMLIFS